MTYTITFHPNALEEYWAASIWYEKQQENLGLRFEKAVENKIQQIVKNPLAFGANKNSYRQANTAIFPFVIVYKLNNKAREIYISAIYHTSQHHRRKYRKQ